MEEREESGRTERFIEHQPVERHIINTHSLHNAHLLREILPRELWCPKPLLSAAGRREKHNELQIKFKASYDAKLQKRQQRKSQKAKLPSQPAAADANDEGSIDANANELPGPPSAVRVLKRRRIDGQLEA